MATPLRHNPSNPVTVGIWRISTAGGTAIRKVIGGRERATHLDWHASRDPASWLYWRREALVYETDLPALYADAGIRAPALLDMHALPSERVELLLEDVAGRSGPDLTDADAERFFSRLGWAQGALAGDPGRWQRPWTSRRMLRDHCAAKHVHPELLDDDAAWALPLVRDQWPAGLRGDLRWLHRERERLFVLSEAAPRTLCHLDCWPHNLVQPDGEADSVLLDWAFCGDGALGEDVGNWLAEAVLDDLLPAERLRERTEVLLEAYMGGVQASGWGGDPRWIELGLRASAVKWHWLGALHLERARSGGHHLYGGLVDAHPQAQYAARGAALAELCTWARRAEALGTALGV